MINIKTIIAVGFFLLISCKKEIEKTIEYVPTPTQYSWKEHETGIGYNRVYYNLSNDSFSLFGQNPIGIIVIKGKDEGLRRSTGGITPTYLIPNVGLSDSMFTYVYNKTQLFIKGIKSLGLLNSSIQLSKFDSNITEISNWTRMAINQNKSIILEYLTTDTSKVYNLFLVNIKYKYYPDGTTPFVGFEVKKINIPRENNDIFAVKEFIAINDYYLVVTNSGLFKIELDGTYKKVSNDLVSGSYGGKCLVKGNLIYVFDYNVTLVSNDNANTFTKYSAFNDDLSYYNYYNIGDSTIAFVDNELYSIRFNNATNFVLRPLKRDGIEKVRYNSMALFQDTVYLATTGGIFKKSKKEFFE